MLAGADRAIVLTARGAEQHSKGTDTVTAWINLALALGLPGRPGSGYGCLTGQGNGQGGREHGQKADQLPGYRRIDDPAARAHVAAVWRVPEASIPGPGVSATELLDRLGTPTGPRGLFVFGSNPVVSAPRARHVERRLARQAWRRDVIEQSRRDAIRGVRLLESELAIDEERVSPTAGGDHAVFRAL